MGTSSISLSSSFVDVSSLGVGRTVYVLGASADAHIEIDVANSINSTSGITILRLSGPNSNRLIDSDSSSFMRARVTAGVAPTIWISGPVETTSEPATIVYGDGHDGAAVFDGVNTYPFATLVGSTYTLTRDVFLSDGSKVANGIVLVTAGNKLFCNGKLTNGGDINSNGKNASGATAGSSSTLGSLGIGTSGGNGRSSNTGVAGTNQSNGLQDASLVGGAGGAGGANAGGAGGTYTQAVADNGGANSLFSFSTGFLPGQSSGGNQAQLSIIGGGAGGGGGGSDNGGCTGGGGGGGGGVMVICIYNLENDGTIRANGGDGGNATGSGGNAGSGGGGAGGVIQSISRFRSGNSPTSVGGNPGDTVVGTGALGAKGSNGHVNIGFAL